MVEYLHSNHKDRGSNLNPTETINEYDLVFTCNMNHTDLLKDRQQSSGPFWWVAVFFSLCYYTKGTIFITYVAKYLIKCPIN